MYLMTAKTFYMIYRILLELDMDYESFHVTYLVLNFLAIKSEMSYDCFWYTDICVCMCPPHTHTYTLRDRYTPAVMLLNDEDRSLGKHRKKKNDLMTTFPKSQKLIKSLL